MSNFLQYLWIGLGNGATYALVGLGLVVIFRSTGLLNFAQGEMATFATFIAWSCTRAGLPLWLSVIISMAGGFVLGALLHQTLLRPLGDPHKKPLATVIVTIGIFLGLNSLAKLIWDSDTKELPSLFGKGEWSIGGVSIRYQDAGNLALLAVVAFVFWLLFTKTKLGLAMRAVASNSESAALTGIPVNMVLMMGWGLAGSVGALAGVSAAPDLGLDPNLMILTLVFGFASIALGGFDSLVGAIVGGLVVGVLTSVVPQYVPFLSDLPMLPAFAVIVLVLLVWPQGLFGSSKVERV